MSYASHTSAGHLPPPLSGASVTVYLNGAEVRKFGQGAAEQLVLYPTPEVRVVKKIVSGAVTTEVTVLHHDGLGSVRAVTAGTGMRTEMSSYRPTAAMPFACCISQRQGLTPPAVRTATRAPSRRCCRTPCSLRRRTPCR